MSAIIAWSFDDTPDIVIIAGDWHGNLLWGSHVIRSASNILPAGKPRVIIHVGDFGIWPGPVGTRYLHELSRELHAQDMYLLFIDGNHDDHSQLAALHDALGPGPVPVHWLGRIWHLPRGTRWEWHGVRWLAVGGAGSPDRWRRTAGLSWWPEEVITTEQADSIAAGGVADVLVAHDCPQRFMPLLPPPPREWDLTACRESSYQLQRIADAVMPMSIFHGHLHTPRRHTFATVWGNVTVTGLEMDGVDSNWQVVDCRELPTARITGS